MTYTQYDSSPAGLNYLLGDVKPWEDYVCFRTDEYTSVCVYGLKSDDLSFEDATVRTLTRNTGSGYSSYYTTSETSGVDVDVLITEPYYAYGNVIGVSYALPSTQNVTSAVVCGTCILALLISVFRLVWSLKGGIK